MARVGTVSDTTQVTTKQERTHNMELSLAITIAGLALSAATFFIGRQSAAQSRGKQDGQILTELEYIKSGVDDMKRKMDGLDKNYHNLDSRVGKLEERMKIYHHE